MATWPCPIAIDSYCICTLVSFCAVVNAEHVHIESDGVLKGEFVKVGEPIKFSVTTEGDLEVSLCMEFRVFT